MPEDGIPNAELAQATTNLERALQDFQRVLRRSGINPRPAGGPLFQALRQWRTDQARELRVPPYIIANDAALRAIEEAKPTDLEQLQAVRGVGQARAQTYGAQILAILAKTVPAEVSA